MLNACEFDVKSLNFILACFIKWEQKTNIGSRFIDFLNIFSDVQQGSMLGPLLLIISISDLFMEYDTIQFVSYADDATPYT